MFGLTEDEEMHWHHCLSQTMLLLSLPTFVMLYLVIPEQPYGKTLPVNPAGKVSNNLLPWYTRYLPLLPARWSWTFFESPNLFWCVYCWWDIQRDPHHPQHFQIKSPPGILLLLFFGHYVRRALWYPWFMMNPNTKPMPALVVLAAWSYCCING